MTEISTRIYNLFNKSEEERELRREHRRAQIVQAFPWVGNVISGDNNDNNTPRLGNENSPVYRIVDACKEIDYDITPEEAFELFSNVSGGYLDSTQENKIDYYVQLIVDTIVAIKDSGNSAFNIEEITQKAKNYDNQIEMSHGKFNSVKEIEKNGTKDSVQTKLAKLDEDKKDEKVIIQRGGQEVEISWTELTDQEKVQWLLVQLPKERADKGYLKAWHAVKNLGTLVFNNKEYKTLKEEDAKRFHQTAICLINNSDVEGKALVFNMISQLPEGQKTAVEMIELKNQILNSLSTEEREIFEKNVNNPQALCEQIRGLNKKEGAIYSADAASKRTVDEQKDWNAGVKDLNPDDSVVSTLLGGTEAGIAGNENFSPEERISLVNQIHDYAKDHGIDPEVNEAAFYGLGGLNNPKADKNPQEPNPAEILNKGTNGDFKKYIEGRDDLKTNPEYSKIVSVILNENQENSTNNTTSIGFAQKENVNNNTNVNNNNTEVASTASVIDTPVQTESTSNSSVALGFTATAPKVDTTRLDSINQTITAQTTEAVRAENQAEEVVVTKTTSFIKALQLGKEGVDKFFAENGTIKAVTAVFNNFSQISDQTIITKALQLYKGLSSTEQADILVSAKNGALVELINNSDINALAQCQGETASNFWATKKINEAAEKALEKQA